MNMQPETDDRDSSQERIPSLADAAGIASAGRITPLMRSTKVFLADAGSTDGTQELAHVIRRPA